MQSQPWSWTTLWTKLGLGGKRRRAAQTRSYIRHLRFECCEERAMLAPIIVNSLLDDGGGPKTTLREAIFQANANPDHDTIEFSTNPADGLNGGTITLASQLNITQSVTINASMLAAGLTVSAGDGTDLAPNTGDGFRIFKIGSVNVEINSLTLTGGDLPLGSDPSGGGAISCEAGNLTLKNSVITGNASQVSGGGIWASSSNVTIDNSIIHDNTAAFDGGGLFFDSGDELKVVSDSVISGNTCGGIFN